MAAKSCLVFLASTMVLMAFLLSALSGLPASINAGEKPKQPFGALDGGKSPELKQASTQARVPPDEIEKLVKQLGSDNARTRETASKTILKIGDDSLPHLEVAMTGADTLELKRRTEALYAEISAKAPGPKLPDGVIHVRLPPGTFNLKPVKLNDKVFIRITVGKTIIETQKFYFGDRWGCMQFEVVKDEIHWWAGTLAGKTTPPGSTSYMAAEYVTVDQLKPGSLLVTSPSFDFRWGKDAIRKDLPK